LEAGIELLAHRGVPRRRRRCKRQVRGDDGDQPGHEKRGLPNPPERDVRKRGVFVRIFVVEDNIGLIGVLRATRGDLLKGYGAIDRHVECL